jgi:hypothetical protein
MKHLAYLILFTCLANVTWAQQTKAFTFSGQVFEMNLNDSTETPIMGVPIEVWHGEELLATLESGPKGKYKIMLDKYPSFRIKFGKAPYISKIIDINTKGFQRAAEYGLVNLEMDIIVFKEDNMMGMDFMNYTPFAKAQFNKKKGTMEWDYEYSDYMAKRVQAIVEANKYPVTRREE